MWPTRTQFLTLGFFALLVLLLAQLWTVFQPFVVPLLWARLLVHLTYRPYRWVSHRLGEREGLAAALFTIFVMLLGVGPLLYLGGVVVEQLAQATVALQQWSIQGGPRSLLHRLETVPLLGHWLVGQGETVLQGTSAVNVADLVQTVGGFVVSRGSIVAKNVVEVVLDFLLILFALFFLYKDGPEYGRRLYRLIPLPERHKEKVFARLDHTVGTVVKGIVLTAVLQGTLAGVAYAVFGVPFAAVLGTLTAIASLLPFGGTVLVWGPVAAYLFATAPVWKGLALMAWGAGVVVGIMDTLMRPMIIGHDAHMPTLFLFFSLLGGLAAYGVIGLFVGPILLALVLVALDIYEEEYTSRFPALRETG